MSLSTKPFFSRHPVFLHVCLASSLLLAPLGVSAQSSSSSSSSGGNPDATISKEPPTKSAPRIAQPEAAGDWRLLGESARRQLAVNPLIPAPYRGLARASEELRATDEAVGAYRALALLDDTDPAGVHYHLASLLRQSGKPKEARREVLKSLEQAPRFREALRAIESRSATLRWPITSSSFCGRSFSSGLSTSTTAE